MPLSVQRPLPPEIKAAQDSLAEIADALAKMKRPDAAKAAFDSARESAAKIASDEGRAYALLNIGRKLNAAGDASQGQALLAEAKQIAERIKDPSIRGPLLEEIGK